MISKKKILSIILARKNSKELPGKNTRDLNGKPLLAWPIVASINSKYIDKTLLSTDSEEYAEIGNNYGASTPFLRPQSLSNDSSKSVDAILHAIDFLKAEGEHYDYVVLLEPTSPLTQSSDIDTAIENLVSHKNFSSTVSMSEVVSSHPSFCFKIDDDMKIYPNHGNTDNMSHKRRQDLNKLYFCDGSLYISEIDRLVNSRTFYHDETLAFIVPKWKAFEIDTDLDFFIIEQIMSYYKEDEYKKK